jgi:sporulation protein YlmC with PRC-barrel domain
MKNTPAMLVRATDVIGKTVSNKEDDLGHIIDVVLKKETGEVQYLVLSFGGVFGLGDKLFALPWELFFYDNVTDSLVIDVDKDLLKNAPGFEKDHWPLFDDSYWLTTSDYYN